MKRNNRSIIPCLGSMLLPIFVVIIFLYAVASAQKPTPTPEDEIPVVGNLHATPTPKTTPKPYVPENERPTPTPLPPVYDIPLRDTVAFSLGGSIGIGGFRGALRTTGTTFLFYNVTPHVGLGGEVSAGFSSDQSGTTTDTLHRYTYLFGPEFNLNGSKKVNFFAHPLFGGVHDTGKTTFGTTSVSSSASAFAMAFGGGMDVRLNKHIAIRAVQFDYIPTHFGGSWQSNYRFSAGIVFRLGGH